MAELALRQLSIFSLRVPVLSAYLCLKPNSLYDVFIQFALDLSISRGIFSKKRKSEKKRRPKPVRKGELSLEWRHNERGGVSNHQPHDCLLTRLFRRRSKNTSKLRVTGLCEGNSPLTGEFPA